MSAPTHLSYSQIESYGTCAQKYYLSRIKGLGDDDPAAWSYGGTAVHEGIHTYNLSLMAGDPIDPVLAFQEAWGEMDFPDPGTHIRQSRNEDLAWWRKNGGSMVKNWATWLEENPYTVVGTEVEVAAEISGVEIIGSIDAILEHELSDTRLLVDHKTGRNMPKTNLQLGIYKVLLGDRFGHIEHGAFFKPRTVRPRGKPVRYGEMTGPHNLSGWTTEIVEQWITSIQAAKEHGIYPPSPSALCPYCDVRSSCYAYGAHTEGNA